MFLFLKNRAGASRNGTRWGLSHTQKGSAPEGHRASETKQVLCPVNSSPRPLPLPPVGRNPRSRPPPSCEAEFTGPGPGAAQPLLLPPGGWASPSRTHRAWAAVHPQPGFCDLSSSCQNPHMWSTQGSASETPLGTSSQAVCCRLGYQSLGVSETHPARRKLHTVDPDLQR